MALLKLCRCGTKINLDSSFCNSCIDKQKERHKVYNKVKRDKHSTDFYNSKEWRALRKQALERDHGLCQQCLSNKKITKAEIVDHVVEIKENWDLRLSLNNLNSLCRSCHNKKTFSN